MNNIGTLHQKAILKIALPAVMTIMTQANALADTTVSTATTTPLSLSSGNLNVTSSGAVTYLVGDTVYTSAAFGTINNAGLLDAGLHAIHLGSSADAVVNSGTITAASIGIYNVGGTLGSLINTGTITATGGTIVSRAKVLTMASYAGVYNLGTITTLNNSGSITGAYGINNTGTISSFTNSGTISGSSYALYNGSSASLSAITNSGTLAGNITNLSASDLTINGDSSGTVGSLSGYNGAKGLISNTASNLVFGSGSQLLYDDINVGTYTVKNTAATLRIANPVSITGNYTQEAGGTLQIGVASMTNYGALNVSGTATLAGTLNVDAANASGLSAGTLASVIHARSISGMFSSVTDNSTLFDFAASYTGTDVNLTVSASSQTGVYDAVTTASNTPAIGAAHVLDSIIVANPSGAIATLFRPLATSQAVSNAVSQTLPLLTGASTQATQTALSGINQVIQARQEGGSSSSGLASGDNFFYGNKQFWMKPFGSWANQDDKNGVSGYYARSSGLVFGADADLSAARRVGVAFAYASTNVTSNSSIAAQSDDIKSYQLSAYGSHQLGAGSDLTYRAGLGQSHNSARRSLSFASGEASATYNSLTTTLGIGFAHGYLLNEKTSFTPSVSADYTRVKEDGYQESGSSNISAVLLKVDSRAAENLILAIDGKFNHRLDDNKTTVHANFGIGYDALNGQSSISSSYAAAPTASFITYGLDTSPWLARAGVGIARVVKDGVELSARYDAEYRSSFLSQTASVKAKWAF